MPPLRTNRLDIIIAELSWGGKCGHAALAAVLCVSMQEARGFMPVRRVTLSALRTALSQAGRRWRNIGNECPAPGKYGLVALSFGDGPGHAVAVWNDGSKIMAFDNHSARWLKLRTWETLILPILKFKRTSGRRQCWIDGVIEVDARHD